MLEGLVDVVLIITVVVAGFIGINARRDLERRIDNMREECEELQELIKISRAENERMMRQIIESQQERQ